MRFKRSKRTLSLPCLGLAISLGMLAASHAVAQTQASSPRANVDPAGYRELVDEGLREFDAQNFDEARSLFLRAHALSPSARTHRALGLVEFELRRYVESISHLEAALASTIKPLNAEQRAEVQRILARAHGFVCRLQIEVRPTSAQVFLDGDQLNNPQGEQLLLAIGKHMLEVKAAGFQAERREVTVDGGEERMLTFVLSPARSETGKAVQQPAEAKHWYKSPWLWAGLGVVVVGAAGGASYALLHQEPAPAASGGTSGNVLAGP